MSDVEKLNTGETEPDVEYEELPDSEDDGAEFRKKSEEIVQHALEEEELITQNLHKYAAQETWLDVVEDKITYFSGSWPFILSIIAVITGWIILARNVDPFPYILLNLGISVVCVMQSPFILMNQWRKEDKDRQRAEQEYLVNLKAEIEIRLLIKQQKLLLDHVLQGRAQTKLVLEQNAQILAKLKSGGK